jgi:hypothetical protein
VLEAQGITIYSEQSYVPWTKALENLRDGEGNPITLRRTAPARAGP